MDIVLKIACQKSLVLGGFVDRCKSRFKDGLQQSNRLTKSLTFITNK